MDDERRKELKILHNRLQDAISKQSMYKNNYFVESEDEIIQRLYKLRECFINGQNYLEQIIYLIKNKEDGTL